MPFYSTSWGWRTRFPETKRCGSSATADARRASLQVETPTKSRFFATLRSPHGGTCHLERRVACHPDPALREKDLLFFAPRDQVGAY